MTREEALAALELTDPATRAEVDRAYEQHFNDFGIRLDNAPTTNLRERFQARLQRLEEAYALLRCEDGGAAFGDLPASGPMSGAAGPVEEPRRPADARPPPDDHESTWEGGASDIIGIDWGNSKIALSFFEGGETVIIDGPVGGRETPAVVAFTRDRRTLIGAAAQRQATQNPSGTVSRLLRLLAAEPGDEPADAPWETRRTPEGRIRLCLSGLETPLLPEEVAAILLDTLLRTADGGSGVAARQAVVAVPVGFGVRQRQRVADACKIAGVQVARISTSPVAAALACGPGSEPEVTLVVCDLGAASFDIAVVDVGDNIHEVLATGGDSDLGGDAFDRRIADWLVEEVARAHEVDLSGDAVARHRLMEAAEQAKRELSAANGATIEVPYLAATPAGPVHLKTTLTRTDFEGLVDDLVQGLIPPLRRALEEAGRAVEQVEPVLIGGPSRIPLVRRVLKDFFGRDPRPRVDPDLAVASGLAIQVGVLTGRESNVLLMDVAPSALGLVSAGGRPTPALGRSSSGGDVVTLIRRDATIPIRNAEWFTTAEDDQTEVEIQLVEGEDTLVRFRLEGLDPVPAGVARIEVAVDIDAAGGILVSARDEGSGAERRVRVEKGGLPDSDVDRCIANVAALRQREEDS